jgi:hypothetical protein
LTLVALSLGLSCMPLSKNSACSQPS